MTSPAKRIDPSDMTERWRKLWRDQAAGWMSGEGEWPRAWGLHPPTEAEARADFDGTRRWSDAWKRWAREYDAVSALQWETRQWRGLGTQELPVRIECAAPNQLAGWVGEDVAWRRATQRFARLAARHPALAPALRRYYTALAHDAEEDQTRVESLLDWLLAHPASGLYPRQLPVAGLDTKWLTAGRKRQLCEWLRQIRGQTTPIPSATDTDPEPDRAPAEATSIDIAFENADASPATALNRDFYDASGLRAEPSFLCLRVLDPQLRRDVGGLTLLLTPPEEATRLAWTVASVLVVENMTTGWALEDLPGTVAVIGRGYATETLVALPWMRAAHVGYWGDLDTHGFGILSGFRTSFPRSLSLMMDMETLTVFRELCVTEAKPHPADSLPGLTHGEAAVYAHLKQNPGLRLEQERIAWNYVWPRLVAWAQNRILKSCFEPMARTPSIKEGRRF